ncbi:hypothetical protein LRY65_00305 [Candidatus Woesebacteria bacterium]|nr:hypothetical protein [Candidatus Woesebacteria bacterium]MCD8526647.1 hypothetical protein [Candidatus Woesebacteria bacterium]MCD8545885.1 hypothetical protein [Candidatus Woesebacteria bacterium]
MKKVSDAVQHSLLADDVALLALQRGVLNMSAYAEQIHAHIERTTMKPVKKGTIVAALARLAPELAELPTLRPEVYLDDIVTRTPLCDVTFPKTPETQQKLGVLYSELHLHESAFFTVTQSLSEITVIAPQSAMLEMLRRFSIPPKAVFTNTVGITVRFSEKYLEIPNVLYTLQSALAVRHINFVEIVSTYTEFSFILDHADAERALEVLRRFLR